MPSTKAIAANIEERLEGIRRAEELLEETDKLIKADQQLIAEANARLFKLNVDRERTTRWMAHQKATVASLYGEFYVASKKGE